MHWIVDPEELRQHMKDMTNTRMKPIRMKRWLRNRMAKLKTKEDVEKFNLEDWDILAWERYSFTDTPHGDEIYLDELVPKLKEELIKKMDQEEETARQEEKTARLLGKFLKRIKTSKVQLDFLCDIMTRIENDKSLVGRILQIIDIIKMHQRVKTDHKEETVKILEKFLKRIKTTQDQFDFLCDIAIRIANDKTLPRRILKIIALINPNSLQKYQVSKANKKAKKLERKRMRAEYEKKVMPIRKRGRKERIRRLRRREEELGIVKAKSIKKETL